MDIVKLQITTTVLTKAMYNQLWPCHESQFNGKIPVIHGYVLSDRGIPTFIVELPHPDPLDPAMCKRLGRLPAPSMFWLWLEAENEALKDKTADERNEIFEKRFYTVYPQIFI